MGYAPHAAAVRYLLQESEFYDRRAARQQIRQKTRSINTAALAERALEPLRLILHDLQNDTPEHRIAVERPHRKILAFLAKHEGGATAEQIQRSARSGRGSTLSHLDRLARYGRVKSNDSGSWWRLAKPRED